MRKNIFLQCTSRFINFQLTWVHFLCRLPLVSRLLRPCLPQLVGESQRTKADKDSVKRYYDLKGRYDKTVKAVPKRFLRLRSGLLIHTLPGRRKHLYRKPAWLREQLREHVVTGRAVSYMLDNMVSDFWRKPKYYPDDIYEPYHQRTGVPWGYQKKKFYP